MTLYVGFLDETHRSSGRPVAYLEEARLSEFRSAGGEEEDTSLLLKHTPEMASVPLRIANPGAANPANPHVIN
jgi:hypothetical protein